MSRSAADLPEDPAELRRFAAALATEVHAKTLLIEKLRMQLSILRRARFGRSSEKLDREIEQLELVLGDIEESEAERQARTEAADGEASSTLPSKKPSVRKPLPDHLPLGRGSRTNSNSSYQIPARVIDATSTESGVSDARRRGSCRTGSQKRHFGQVAPSGCDWDLSFAIRC